MPAGANFCPECGTTPAPVVQVVQQPQSLGRTFVEGAALGVGVGIGQAAVHAAVGAATGHAAGSAAQEITNVVVEDGGAFDIVTNFLG